ncbi:hypothetical protein BDR26DRAFT_850611 [Obelidium mucronatum]|nr:hypothetical protein BDR26DRAFT_850611 [Obelidium mucronatum]
MADYPVTAIILYSVSCLLDALDGYAARVLDQSSRFGAIALRRCVFLVRLALQLPAPLVLVIQFLAALDLASHYSHIHKQIDPNAPYLLRLYYQSKVVLFLVCMLDQWFYIAVYLLTWRDSLTGDLLFISSSPNGGSLSVIMNETIGFVLRTVLLPLSGTPLVEVAIVLIEETGTVRMIIWMIAILSGFVSLLKQILNIIQLVGAAKDLAAFDVKSRAKGKRKQ